MPVRTRVGILREKEPDPRSPLTWFHGDGCHEPLIFRCHVIEAKQRRGVAGTLRGASRCRNRGRLVACRMLLAITTASPIRGRMPLEGCGT